MFVTGISWSFCDGYSKLTGLFAGVGTEPPKFVTKSDTHKTVEGETITLPCAVDHLGESRIVFLTVPTILST